MKQIGIFMVFCMASGLQPAAAQTDSPPKYEFRGVWMASVLNLDWPAQDVDPFFQETSLKNMLDAHKAAGINAVIFQVRAESDALYESAIEPWSYWLTGQQGAAPDPFLDPLELIVTEAHKRGLELHAWFNPYRAIRGSGYVQAPGHVTVLHPEWTLDFGNFVILNPGLPEVRDHVTGVILDVVRRYDVDGVHFDDFFYPYPPNEITNEDFETFETHNRGFTSIHDWRRDNVNLLIAQVSDSLQAVNPRLKFGIGPFGIWKNGVPIGISGLDAANVIYGDAVAWLEAQSIDYVAPQLYWAFGGGQDYAKLAPWWAAQTHGRHIYTGHGLYRSDANTFSGSLFSSTEVPNQIRFNRQHPEIRGSVFFRSKNITNFLSKGFADTLETDLYRYPALTPQMHWKDRAQPGMPQHLTFAWTNDTEISLSWMPASSEDGMAETRRYAVYRVRSDQEPDVEAVVADARNLLAITGDTTLTDRPGIAEDPYYYFVTAVSGNSVESRASDFVTLEGRAVSVEAEIAVAFELFQNFPNPFTTTTEIRFQLDRAQVVSLYVYNMLGQRIATLIDETIYAGGLHAVRWQSEDDADRQVGSGAYYYSLITEESRATKGMVLLR